LIGVQGINLTFDVLFLDCIELEVRVAVDRFREIFYEEVPVDDELSLAFCAYLIIPKELIILHQFILTLLPDTHN